jgi:endonuclease III
LSVPAWHHAEKGVYILVSKRECAERAEYLLSILSDVAPCLPKTMSQKIADEYRKDPFVILISCLLSLRARDQVTYRVSKRLFALAETPQDLLKIPKEKLEKILHSLGFFRRKTETIQAVSRVLLEKFNGQVPRTLKELLSLPGVGRKTANLVLSEAFDVPAICVDTHVHKLANSLRLVYSETPYETECQLRRLINRSHWHNINRLLVMLGQHTKEVCSLVSEADRVFLYPVCKKKEEKEE